MTYHYIFLKFIFYIIASSIISWLFEQKAEIPFAYDTFIVKQTLKVNNNSYIRRIRNNNHMIEYIKGEIAELSPASATIDCNGLGYAVNISLNTYAAIQGKKSCKLYIYEAIREDA